MVAEEPLVAREDLQASIEARRELGRDHEPELVESFVARIEERLAKRPSGHLPARREGREGSFVLALLSVAAGIPLTAIALNLSGLAALLVVWIGIVLVNLGYQRS
ncbi:MAG: hypothetical protein QOG29_810 [Gaiellaceae bacterium]|nr:hypothetical protein [Gaiellaceae bacterium]